MDDCILNFKPGVSPSLACVISLRNEVIQRVGSDGALVNSSHFLGIIVAKNRHFFNEF